MEKVGLPVRIYSRIYSDRFSEGEETNKIWQTMRRPALQAAQLFPAAAIYLTGGGEIILRVKNKKKTRKQFTQHLWR